MVSKLDPEDFRACRRILDPDDFALGGDEPDPPPTDLITKDAWYGIMDLPGDVAIRTTSHQGTRIAILHELWSGWIWSIRLGGSPLDKAMGDAADDFSAALFLLAHGFYRQALGSLRSALEMVTIASYCEIAKDKARIEQWERGLEAKMNEIFNGMQSLDVVRSLDDRAQREVGSSVYLLTTHGRNRPWARDLYRRLSTYSHARPDSTNSQIWNSNGPIYSAAGMKLSYHGYLETYSLAMLTWKLARPTLRIPRTAKVIFKPDSLPQFLESHYSNLCSFYMKALFRTRTADSA